MIDSDRILQRANIQELRSLFLEGIDLTDFKQRPDPRSYEERRREGERPLLEYIEHLYPDGAVRDAVFGLISEAIITSEEIYTEIGMRIGAQIMFELLSKNPCEGLNDETTDKKG